MPSKISLRHLLHVQRLALPFLSLMSLLIFFYPAKPSAEKRALEVGNCASSASNPCIKELVGFPFARDHRRRIEIKPFQSGNWIPNLEGFIDSAGIDANPLPYIAIHSANMLKFSDLVQVIELAQKKRLMVILEQDYVFLRLGKRGRCL